MTPLADILAQARDRGVERLAYFHCDHFEPWRWSPDESSVSAANADAVEAFVEETSRIPYARRLTLFHKSPLNTKLAGRRRTLTLPGDELGFPKLRESEWEAHVRAMGAIARSEHEIQVHIHHERFTRNEDYSTSPERPENEKFRDFLTNRTTPEMDEARLRFHIELTLKLFRKATGLPFQRWLFVHGMWSLNGSDRDFCTVDGELLLLRRLGCLGDFTFPAPRLHCNPASDRPYLVKPIRAPKAYDHPDAHRKPADGRPAKRRFFVWSTVVSPNYCSIDTVSRSFAKLAEDPDRWASGLMDGAVEQGGAIYAKTHAHSMMGAYFDGPRPVYPHTNPGVARLFERLMEGAERAGLRFETVTAQEVYDRFVGPDPAPAQA